MLDCPALLLQILLLTAGGKHKSATDKTQAALNLKSNAIYKGKSFLNNKLSLYPTQNFFAYK